MFGIKKSYSIFNKKIKLINQYNCSRGDLHLYSKDLLDILKYKWSIAGLKVKDMKKNVNAVIELLDKYKKEYFYYWINIESINNNKENSVMEIPMPLSVRQLHTSILANIHLKDDKLSLEKRLNNAYHEIIDCIDDYGKGNDDKRIVTVNEYTLYYSLFTNLMLVIKQYEQCGIGRNISEDYHIKKQQIQGNMKKEQSEIKAHLEELEEIGKQQSEALKKLDEYKKKVKDKIDKNLQKQRKERERENQSRSR